MIKPRVIEHDDVFVVRDDLFPGGTKARFLPYTVRGCRRGCLCKPGRGRRPNCFSHSSGTAWQTRHDICGPARATASANIDGKTARRPDRASPAGYLTAVQKRAAEYCHQTGAVLAPFGFDIPGAAQAIAAAARSIGIQPDEVWCAGGSGVLARGLAQAWPNASRHVVQVGRTLSPNDVAGATIHVYPKPFKWATKNAPPFPSDPHYDAKAWEFCLAHKGSGRVLFWNVTGPAQP